MENFARFAAEEGFHTLEHPRANREAESFMKILNKTEQITHLQHQDRETAMQEIGFRLTFKPRTGVTLYEGMMNRKVQMKLDHINHSSNSQTSKHRAVIERDKRYNRN